LRVWPGFHAHPATHSVWLSAPLAVCRCGIALVTFWFFNMVFEKTQSSSESRQSTVVGMIARLTRPSGERCGRNRLRAVEHALHRAGTAEGNVAIAAGPAGQDHAIVAPSFMSTVK